MIVYLILVVFLFLHVAVLAVSCISVLNSFRNMRLAVLRSLDIFLVLVLASFSNSLSLARSAADLALR